jgi:S1-C subfamily serine protease
VSWIPRSLTAKNAEKNLSMSSSRILVLAVTTLASAAAPAQEKEVPTSQPHVVDAKTPKQFEKVATLGVETRAPTKEECARYALELNVRYKGQLIERLTKDGVGAAAGLRIGDVILMLDKVEIFSGDDIRDLLMVRKPGQQITLQVMRAKDQKQVTVRLKLGEQKIP